MLGWSREKVKNYASLRQICSEAWKIIGTTFDVIVPNSSSEDVPAFGTNVPFTEGLLRSILDLTPEQQIREGMTWEPIEEARAKRRQGYENFSPGKFSGTEKGDIRDIIARRVGLGSGKTYESGKEVVEYMDRMLEIGSERGDILKMTLNDDSINAASKSMKKYKQLDATQQSVSKVNW